MRSGWPLLSFRRVARLVVLSCAVACGSGQDEADAPPVLHFDAAHMRMITGADTARLLVELAKSAEQRTLGLMERRHLADSAGMLFLYAADQPASAAYWMFRTRVPLDIAFLDSLGTVRSIQHMVPCTTSLAQGCPSYPPGVPYRSALEVNAGYFARRGIALGSRLAMNDTTRAPSARLPR